VNRTKRTSLPLLGLQYLNKNVKYV